ncbi:hypothetical protein [Intrasporangium sp.]|jgi:hypothetical protein|uniref:hypothetical protein n=1 Tax=Intrasporangium sp. TaxID=1925024 RepID=UPI00336582A8
MVPPPLRDPALVDAVRVKVTLEAPDGPDEVFLLDLELAEPAPPHDDTTYLSALSPVVELMDTPEGCTVRIGREHRLGADSASALDVDVSLPRPTVRADETDPTERNVQHEAMEAAVAAAFRSVIDAFPAARMTELGHDEALALARRRIEEAAPDAATAGLSVTAEEHANAQWAVRLDDGTATGYEVRVGFADGHPGTTHVRRIRTPEVVDSVGAD